MVKFRVYDYQTQYVVFCKIELMYFSRLITIKLKTIYYTLYS